MRPTPPGSRAVKTESNKVFCCPESGAFELPQYLLPLFQPEWASDGRAILNRDTDRTGG
jgi:hypothetical protein